MGSSSMFSFAILVFLACLREAQSTVDISSAASSACFSVAKGTSSYVLLKLSVDFTTVEVVKTSSGHFDGLSADLVAAKESGNPLYALFNAKVESGGALKLVFFAWLPSSSSQSARNCYKDLADDVVNGVGIDVSVLVYTGSEDDLSLDYIKESFLAGYNVIESSQYYYDMQDTIVNKVKITVESNVVQSFSRITKGYNPYCIFSVSIANSAITIYKLGAPGAGFDNLVADLQGSNTPKFAFFITSVFIGGKTTKKLFLINWIPAQVSDSDRVKIRALIPQLKDALKADVFYDFQTSSSDDLDLNRIINLSVGGKIETPTGHVQFNLDAGARASCNDVARGALRFVLFKFSADLTTIMVDSVGSIKSIFNDFIDALAKVQSQKRALYAIYYATFRVKGKVVNKPIAFNWIPFNVPEKLRTLYDTNFKSFKVLTKIDLLPIDISPTSIGDLNLDAILKVAVGNDYQGQGDLGGNVLGMPDDNIPAVQFDNTCVNGINLLLKGTKRYAIFSLRNGLMVLEKLVDISASFNDLKLELANAERLGQAKYAFFLAPVNVRGRIELKLILINWVPRTVSNTLRLIYIKSVPKLKLALGIEFWFEFTALTLYDLDLSGLTRVGQKQSLLKLSIGPKWGLGAGILNPFAVVGTLVGTAGNVAGGLVCSILQLGVGLFGGVLNLGVNILGGLLGGALGLAQGILGIFG